MSETPKESIGRIEVAPEVLATIAHYATLRVEGVSKMASIPADAARLFRRATKHNGVLLNHVDDKVSFGYLRYNGSACQHHGNEPKATNGRFRIHQLHGRHPS